MDKAAEGVDRMHPYLLPHAGIFQEEMEVNDVRRSVLMYVPEQTRSSAPGIMILPDDGVSAQEMFERSSWRELADTEEEQEKPILMFLEPYAGKWHPEETCGCPDGDVAYVMRAQERFAKRDLFCVHEAKFYMAGYGAGAAIAQMSAMYDPALYAGVAAVAPLPIRKSYMETVSRQPCIRLNGFEDETGLGIRKGEVPVPVWLIRDTQSGSELTDEILYWRAALGADRESRIDHETVQYARSAQTDSLMNQQKEAYRLWISDIRAPQKDNGYLLNRKIWKKFLYPVRRWMSQPVGDLRLTKQVKENPHIEYHYEMADGWMREWYVYVPDAVKENPHRKVPLVFAMHGYSCSGAVYLENSGWDMVADRYGFIVVFPSAVNGSVSSNVQNRAISLENTCLPSWNIYCRGELPDELAFFAHMRADLMARYRIDEDRVYATGHSLGSLMTQMLAIARPQWFAAAAPCSGVFFLDALKKMRRQAYFTEQPAADVPIWMFGGEREEWLLPAVPQGDNITAETIRFWCARNGLDEIPEEMTQTRTVQGLWHDYIFRKGSREMVRYTWAERLPHGTMPQMSFRIWEEFFSKNSRG